MPATAPTMVARDDAGRIVGSADDAAGDFVGLNDIVVNRAARERVHVGTTAVEPAHRGRALGKWLKGR